MRCDFGGSTFHSRCGNGHGSPLRYDGVPDGNMHQWVISVMGASLVGIAVMIHSPSRLSHPKACNTFL
jgi:hypothetical protein